MTSRYRIIINGKYGFIDRHGEIVIEPKYDWVEEFSDGLARVTIVSDRLGPFQDAKVFYIDAEGETALEASGPFDGVELPAGVDPKTVEWIFDDFSDGLARVEVRYVNQRADAVVTRVGYIDKSGKVSIEISYLDCERFSEGLGTVKLSEAGRELWGALDVQGNWMIKPQLSNRLTYLNEGRLRCRKEINGSFKSGFIDRQGVVRVPFSFELAEDFSDGLAAVCNDRAQNYVDLDGEILLKEWVERGSNFDSGVAYIVRDNRLELIDKTGSVLLRLIDDCSGISVDEFSEGLALLATGGNLCDTPGLFKFHGFLNACGEIVIPDSFKHAHAFKNGLAKVVTQDGQEGYINRNGDFVWKTSTP